MNQGSNKKSFFKYPWGYREGFQIAAILLVVGLLFELITNGNLQPVTWPVNIVSGLVLILVIVLIWIFLKKKPLINWLSSVNAAVSSIVLFSVLLMIMGFVKQAPESEESIITDLGLNHIANSHAYFYSVVFLLTSLGLVILKRSIPLKSQNIGFLLNHFGLWLIIFSATLGAGDTIRVKMVINIDHPVSTAYDQSGKQIDLNLQIQLLSFDMETYPPKAYIVDSETGERIYENKNFYLKKDTKGHFGSYFIKVLDFIDNGIGKDSTFYHATEPGAAPAALVEISHRKFPDRWKGWITCGSFSFPGNYMKINTGRLLIMGQPEPKTIQSEILVRSRDGEVTEATVGVNRPIKIDGWKIYQLDYNKLKGKWSDISIIELVKDPWLPAVYSGIFIMMAGAFFMLWTGLKKQKS